MDPWGAEHPREERLTVNTADRRARLIDCVLVVVGLGGLVSGSLGFQRFDVLNIALSTIVYLIGGASLLLGARALRRTFQANVVEITKASPPA